MFGKPSVEGHDPEVAAQLADGFVNLEMDDYFPMWIVCVIRNYK